MSTKTNRVEHGPIKIPARNPLRPPFRRNPSFMPLCYEFPITFVRPEWLWSEEDLQGEPREEPGLFLSYRESGRYHTIVWAHQKQWLQWKRASLFGDAPSNDGLDRSKIDQWSHQRFCEQLQYEADREP